jgi:transposase, IS30 family
LLKGASNRSSVGSLVARKTRLEMLSRMEGNGTEAALAGFTKKGSVVSQLACAEASLAPRGMEMACHPELACPVQYDI